jgi:hypothetical protein
MNVRYYDSTGDEDEEDFEERYSRFQSQSTSKPKKKIIDNKLSIIEKTELLIKKEITGFNSNFTYH